MSDTLDPVLYGLVCTATLWLALLWAAARLQAAAAGWIMKLVLGAATVPLLFWPATGLPLWKWVFGFCPNPSLPLLGLVCGALWQRLFGVVVFTTGDFRAAWVFGAVAGCVLYLPPLGLGTADLYYWGWHHSLAVWVIAGCAVLFLCWGNRLGVLFAAALVAYELQALDSPNGWDYVIDPFYWLISSSVLLARAAGAWRKRRRQNQAAGDTPVDAEAAGAAGSLQAAESVGAPGERIA
ncbi:MAG TPA: hypothetical protein VGD81_10705 [Opitutaceae bacterium]